MILVEIAHSTTVAHHQVFKSPFITQYLLEQTGRTTAWIIIQTLVSTHHLTHIGILNQCLESRHICLPKIAGRHICKVCCVTCILWTAMYGIVLGTSPEFTILCIFRTLQALHNLDSHHACKIRILTISLLTTSPTGITEDVYVRGPYRQTSHLHILTFQVVHTMVVLGTELGTGDVEHLIKQIGIK